MGNVPLIVGERLCIFIEQHSEAGGLLVCRIGRGARFGTWDDTLESDLLLGCSLNVNTI